MDTRGFGAQLAHLYQRRLDFINRGFSGMMIISFVQRAKSTSRDQPSEIIQDAYPICFLSGYTTEQAIHLLPQFLPRIQQQQQQEQQQGHQFRSTTPKIQFLTIFFGANDASLPPSRQYVELNRYQQNLRELIDIVHNPSLPTYSPETRIILICPPPVHGPRWAAHREGQGKPMDRDEEVAKQYADACLKVGREYQAKNALQQPAQYHQVDVIDTYGLMMEQVKLGHRTLEDYLKDGVHLASEGNNVRKWGDRFVMLIWLTFPQ